MEIILSLIRTENVKSDILTKNSGDAKITQARKKYKNESQKLIIT